ncbi:putative 60s ribosomal protein l38 [Phaeomoniella chlamydospora]|uniref:Putative 60s ribosomal protein l38 n=1 Tax=Phaeomoniella chlamydospora TaxID=158046 RepID=A0A0G2F2N2_PHACM|nr:putative 60s ribosomal protein l38 [Phaeomoniella chlamydospora]
MPSEVADIKQFLEIARRKDASSARIKKSSKKTSTGGAHQQIKFKIRCHRFVYTLVLKDADKADKLKQSLPPNMQVTEINSKGKKGSKK